LLKTIACYGVVFEGLTGDALAEYVHATAISAPGYKDWCRHQHEITRRTTVWARAAEKYYWALGTEPKREGGFTGTTEGSNVIPINQNAQRALDAQRRIREAVERLSNAGELPAEATLRKEALERQGISGKTLYKYPDLWHPGHQAAAPSDTGCKPAQPEGDSTDLSAQAAESVKSPERRQGSKVYTLEEIMKRRCPELPFSGLGTSRGEIKTGCGLDFNEQGYPRRILFTKSVTTGTQQSLEVTEPLSNLESMSREVKAGKASIRRVDINLAKFEEYNNI
jgi:hypothetical protein